MMACQKPFSLDLTIHHIYSLKVIFSLYNIRITKQKTSGNTSPKASNSLSKSTFFATQLGLHL